VKRGDVARGLAILREVVNEPRVANLAVWFTALLSDLGEAYGVAGDHAMGLATLDRALERVERLGEEWIRSELLQLKGRITFQRGQSGDAEGAERLLRQSIAVARDQAILSSELRAATDLAWIWRQQKRLSEAHDLLAPVYDRFTEGFATTDLRTAKALLDSLTEG
jgi:predicted ATPase